MNRLKNLNSKNLIILIYLFFIASCNSISSNAQTKIIDKEFNFEIIPPCECEKSSNRYRLEKNIKYSCNVGLIIYEIESIIFENGMYDSNSKDIEFDLRYTQNSFKKTNSVRMLNATPKSLNGYPGIEFQYEDFNKEKTIFKRVYIIKNQLIELSFQAPIKFVFAPEIEDFFLSIKLINIEKNVPPYLNFPSEEELKNRPYEANFLYKTKQNVQVLESFLGKSVFIMEFVDLQNSNTGVASLLVAYAILPPKTSISDKERLLTEQIALLQKVYPNSTLIDSNKIENGYELLLEYKLGDNTVIDKRKIFYSNDTYFNVVSIRYKNAPENEMVETFLKSFKLK